MDRVYNFGAGPAAMPHAVLQSAHNEFLNYHGLGMSILEMSHRSKEFQELLDDTKKRLSRILEIPDTHDIIFLQGGATLLFAGIPLNLLHTKAGYLISGNFSNKAYLEAQKYGEAIALASSKDSNFSKLPTLGELPHDLDYVHICQNNTIFGTQYHTLPDTQGIPLVSDVSSCFLSAPTDVSRYGALYAGVQKNAGPAGLSITIINKELLGQAQAICPSYLDFALQVKNDSMLNTPNTWAIYLCNKVFSWIEDSGGLSVMEAQNKKKSNLIYDFLDESKLFYGTASKEARSIANVCFTTGDSDLDAAVIAGASEQNIVGIKGHRLVGGMRASCYNAVPYEAAQALVDYLYTFEKHTL